MGVKAFVFTLDAMYAVLLLSLFLISYSFLVPHVEDISLLNKVGYDLLSSLEKSDFFTFLDEDESTINSNLDAILSKLPENINGEITLERYKEQSGAIVLEDTFSRQDSEPLDEKIVVQRAVPDIDNDKYYLIKMGVWYE